jgi:signal transduction histidine kinase/AraC-like DNA-binding protein/ABC-type sugar transport system substrate-binding protein
MSRTFRIGVQIGVEDPFWVQVREAVYERALQRAVDVFPLDIDSPYSLPSDEHLSLIEELQAQEIDALVCLDWPETLAERTLQLGIPIIHLTESALRHPRFVSPLGLFDIARDIGLFLAQQLAGRGRVLVVGGRMHQRGEDGQSRLAGLSDALRNYPGIHSHHIYSLWTYESAYQQVRSAAWPPGEHFDALFGLSDSLALGGRDAGRELGLLDSRSLIVGINGDPLALAAILNGGMTATVQTSATDIAEQAIDLALQAAQKQPLPAHFSYNPGFVTAQNVNEMAAQKLTAIASLPTRLIGDNRRQAQQRLSQLETSLRINQQLGALLDRRRLHQEIADLIRVSYGYDIVLLYRWDEAARSLICEGADRLGREHHLPVDESGPLAEALRRNESLFIPDTHHSHRFPGGPDPAWPDTRSRVVVPIRLGQAVLGLLDLHSRTLRQHARQDLIGLQSLADQMGLAMRNAELYEEAVKARAMAEKADQIKTRLLANVSHELRTPLNVILGYASAPRTSPNADEAQVQQTLLRDLQQIYTSGEHLLRVINDLLDLSRAEINELDLFPEIIDTRAFLDEVFRSVAEGLPARHGLAWRLQLPDRLPAIQADPVRLRQILLNLLNNAHKFTSQGEIVLGAEVAPPHLHLWVQDTGVGIPIDLQERIFEPFATSLQTRRRGEGVGLGLSITRRLVLLHGGTITLESQPGQGSTFHLYLPLPSLSGQSLVVPEGAQPVLVVISASDPPPAAIRDLSHRRGWAIHRLHRQAHLSALLKTIRPVALAWDLAGASLDDWTLIQAIRAQPQLATLPFILYGTEQLAAPESGVGLTNYLVKPLGQQTLLDTINGLRPAIASGPVLIVDDDPQARALYADLVIRALPGYSVRTAESGAKALEMLAEATPALAILHLMMPDVDGFKILEEMRTRPATWRVPVVIMSGRTLSFDDVRRLDHMYVTFHNKYLLSQEETAAAFHQALAGANALPPQTSLVVKHAIAYLHQNYHRAISRQELAMAVGVSKDYLSHIFHQELSLSPWEYLSRYRVQQAKALLRRTHESVTDIAAHVGFDNLSYFNRVFRKHAGCSPTAYREGSPET